MKAKYYIYRNLTQKTFSVKHKGKIIAHCDNILAMGATFKVNEKSRQRTIDEKKKYVHAYVVCDDWQEATTVLRTQARMGGIEVKYNPLKNDSFVILNGVKILNSEYAVLTNSKVYIPNLLEE